MIDGLGSNAGRLEISAILLDNSVRGSVRSALRVGEDIDLWAEAYVEKSEAAMERGAVLGLNFRF